MSIHELRQDLRDIPGGPTVAMRYEDGGKVEVYIVGTVEISLPAGADHSYIATAIREALKT